MDDTKVANDPKMMLDAHQVAKIGFKAMPAQATAEMHRKLAEPGKAPDMETQKDRQ